MTVSSPPEIITEECINEAHQRMDDCTQWPAWAQESQIAAWGEKLFPADWFDRSRRFENGWKGRDLLHDANAPIRVLQYYARCGNGEGVDGHSRGGVGTTLTGIVHFTPKAESQSGHCHGGGVCIVLDDAMTWCSFMVSGRVRPWSGYSSQLDTTLKRPIPVGSILMVRASVVRVDRRKIFLEAKIVGEVDGDEVVYAQGQGVMVVNRGVLPLSHT